MTTIQVRRTEMVNKGLGCRAALKQGQTATAFDGRVWCDKCHTKYRPASRYIWYERGKMPRDGYCGEWVA